MKATQLIRGKPKQIIEESLNNYCDNKNYSGKYPYVLRSDGYAFPFSEFQKNNNNSEIEIGLKQGLLSIVNIGIPNAKFRVKNNLRLNYENYSADKSIYKSVKIGLPCSGYRSGSLAREIKAHKILNNIVPNIRLPKLYGYDMKTLKWVEEEYLQSNGTPNIEKAEFFLRNHAEDLYKPFLRFRTVLSTLRFFGVCADQIESIITDTGQTFSKQTLKEKWAISMIHGDLSPGNMISSKNNKLYLVDWENFRLGVVAWDLRKLYNICPHIVIKLLSFHPKTPIAQGL